MYKCSLLLLMFLCYKENNVVFGFEIPMVDIKGSHQVALMPDLWGAYRVCPSWYTHTTPYYMEQWWRFTLNPRPAGRCIAGAQHLNSLWGWCRKSLEHRKLGNGIYTRYGTKYWYWMGKILVLFKISDSDTA